MGLPMGQHGKKFPADVGVLLAFDQVSPAHLLDAHAFGLLDAVQVVDRFAYVVVSVGNAYRHAGDGLDVAGQVLKRVLGYDLSLSMMMTRSQTSATSWRIWEV